MQKAKVIAEIGCNHRGDLQTAKQMIETAVNYCGADVVKFQKRNVKECLTPEQYNMPHPRPENSYGKTYGEHRENLEFDIKQHEQLKDFTEKLGAQYSCSVWDLTSATEIALLRPKMIKVPSALNRNHRVLNELISNYSGEIHLSTGMTSLQEVEQIVAWFINKGAANRLVLYHSTSGYPIAFSDVSLKNLQLLSISFSEKIKGIGYSGHHLGIAIDPVAFGLGAKWIERHFTLDRTWKGTDHAASLEPDGLKKLVRDLDATAQAMETRYGLHEIEIPQFDKLKKNQIVKN